MKLFNKDNFIEYVIVAGLFLHLFGEIAIVAFVLMFILINKGIRSIKLNKYMILIGLLIIILSLYSTFIYHYSYGKILQQIVLVGFFYFSYYIILSNYKDRIYNIFDKYINVTNVVCVLGFVQLLIFMVTHKDIFAFIPKEYPLDYTFRISSIMGEPGGLAQVITPAVIYSLIKLKKTISIRYMISPLCYILSYSSTAYLILFLFMLFEIRNLIVRHKIVKQCFYIFALPLLLIFSTSIYKINLDNDDKITETFVGLQNIEPQSFEVLNASSYATLSNLYISIKSQNRIIGNGIGTHPESYERIYQSDYYLYGLNKMDAYSLGIRLFSEFGLIGILSFFLFILLFYNKNNISVSLVFLFIFTTIRGGHYTLFGFSFFILLYYFLHKKITYDLNNNSCL